ncbi:MAG TPA: glycoside hydrolase family 30 protein [Opitutaceae bacterium]|nr:glycoside hydrolase family 30 protein [Opitutaceae bacterium]
MKIASSTIPPGALAALFLLGTLPARAAGPAQPREYLEARAFLTAEATGELLHDLGDGAFAPLEQPDEDYPTVMIDPGRTFQEIEGFGGAFTDAAAVTFAKLPAKTQEQFLQACFDPVEGNAYNLCRTTIHSCDFADAMYTYDDVAGDTGLTHFSIAHDEKYRIPFMKRALAAAHGNIKIFASPWSPPAWMKTNDDMLHGGKLRPEYARAWADYFVKYVRAYQTAGIPIWGLTVQNEAMATQVWESCIFTAAEERDFVRDHLGPALEAGGLGGVKLMIWDHNRGIMYQRAQVAYEDPAASRYIWGTAFHWYIGDHFDNVRLVHDAFPEKKLLYTEGGMHGSWASARRLARNMIMDLNNWTNGWVFWNLLLDQTGGPRHAGGLPGAEARTSNIINVDLATGELTFNPPHYVFGQFSRFIRPGARRIACTSNHDDLLATGFLNPDGKIAVVVFNAGKGDRQMQLWVGSKAIRYTLPAEGVITIVL